MFFCKKQTKTKKRYKYKEKYNLKKKCLCADINYVAINRILDTNLVTKQFNKNNSIFFDVRKRNLHKKTE